MKRASHLLASWVLVLNGLAMLSSTSVVLVCGATLARGRQDAEQRQRHSKDISQSRHKLAVRTVSQERGELSNPDKLAASPHRQLLSAFTTLPKFWWSTPTYDYWEAGALCSSYGGQLAVLNTQAELNITGLNRQVAYWIGLFNAAQLPGQAGTWTWVDQSRYNSTADFMGWAEGQPGTSSHWCVTIQYLNDGWRWVAASCSDTKAVMCELVPSAPGAAARPLSCLPGRDVGGGSTYLTLPPASLGNVSSQHPQLCAAACRADLACNAFALSSSRGCLLRQRGVTSSTVSDATLSCFRYGLDWVAYGQTMATVAVGSQANGFKCLQNYQVNMALDSTRTNLRSAASCVAACTGNCTVAVYTGRAQRCQLGRSPLYGPDLLPGPISGASVTTCLEADSDWLLLGAAADPSLITTVSGTTLYTLHPEQLPYSAAAAVCRAQGSGNSRLGPGSLAALDSIDAVLTVARKLLLDLPPRMLMPVSGVEPGMYGVWVGLQPDGPSLYVKLLLPPANATVSQPPVLRWDSGAILNASLLQRIWATPANGSGVLIGMPQTAGRSCVSLSNSTQLRRPGLVATGACSWALPFVCQNAMLSPSPSPPPPSFIPNPALNSRPPPTPPSPTPILLGGLLGDVPPNPSDPRPPFADIVGLPTFVSSPSNGYQLMWLASDLELAVGYDDAVGLCGEWNASLAVLSSQQLQLALQEAADGAVSFNSDGQHRQTQYWMGLAVDMSSGQWQWGDPDSPTASNSSLLLASWSDWCTTASDPASLPPEQACAALTYSPGTCSDSWGWLPSDCSKQAGYVCQAKPEGVPNRYFCADGYDLDGTLQGSPVTFPGASLAEAATYCAAFCTASPACHAFSVSGGTCTRLSRNATSPYGDLLRDGSTLGCFKYPLLWDTLGGSVAVASGVAGDASTRFRCMRDQDISRMELAVLNILSCRIADCTAQCFAVRLCSVAVFDFNTCRCSLARRPLSGLDGSGGYKPGTTTCIYDDTPAFLALGLSRAKRYILPFANSTGGAGSSGDWLSPGPNTGPGSQPIDNINFQQPPIAAPSPPLAPPPWPPSPPPPRPLPPQLPPSVPPSTPSPVNQSSPNGPPDATPTPATPLPLPSTDLPPEPYSPAYPVPPPVTLPPASLPPTPQSPSPSPTPYPTPTNTSAVPPLVTPPSAITPPPPPLPSAPPSTTPSPSPSTSLTPPPPVLDKVVGSLPPLGPAPAAVPPAPAALPAATSGGPTSYSMPQMVGTTVGVSCFLLLAVLAFLIHSRRKASIAAAIKQTHPASPSGAALDPSHMSPKLASTLQALNGLTAAESPLTTSGKLQAVSSMLNSLVMSKSVNKEVDTILARHRDGTAPLTPSSLSMLTTLAGLGPETGNELGRTRTRYPSDDKWNSALSKLDQSSGVPGQLSAHPSSGLETESGAWPLGATVSITLDSSKPSQQLSQGASMGLSLGNLQLGSQQLSQGLGQALTQGLGTCSSRGLGQASSQGLAPTQSASQDSSQGTQPSLDSSNRSSPAAGKMISTQPASLASTQAAQATGSPRAAASGIAAGAGQGAKGMSPQQAMQMQPRPAPPAPDPGMAWCANNLLASNSGTVSTFVTLTRQLGAGSFGTVYAGIWGNTEVAVKIIAHTPAAAQRVKNEVELSLRLDHPNVVRSFFYETFDLQCAAGQEARTMGRDTQETWIVLELCTAGSLSSRLYSASHGQARSSRGRDDEAVPMPLPMKLRDPMLSTMTRLLQVALGVAQGMAYLHSLSITHGDLKTENVLLTTDSNGNTVAKVGDFGLSRAMGDNCPTHLSTATVGTVTHMPPELLSEGRLRPSCDVYSFGIILWQLFTGEVPYAGMHYAVIVYQVTSRGMRPVFPDSAPPAFRLLAERCWAAEEASRPSFPEIITYLQQLLAYEQQQEQQQQQQHYKLEQHHHQQQQHQLQQASSTDATAIVFGCAGADVGGPNHLAHQQLHPQSPQQAGPGPAGLGLQWSPAGLGGGAAVPHAAAAAGRGSGADGSAAVSSSELTARSWGSSSNNTNTTASSSTTTASSARTNTTSASSSSGSGGGSSTMGSDHTLESGVSDKRAARTPGPSTPAPSPPLLPPLESEPGLPAPAFAFSPPSPPWALHPPQQPAMEQQGQGEQRGWQQQGSYPQPLLQIPSEVQQALAPAPLPLLPELTSLPSGAMPWASAPELHAILAALASPGGEGPLPGPSWPAQAQGADTLSSGFMTSSSITAAAAAATAAAAGQQGGGGSGGGGGGASAAAAGPAWPSLHGQSAQSLAEHVSGLLAPSTSVEQALALHSYYQLLLRDQQADGAPG